MASLVRSEAALIASSVRFDAATSSVVIVLNIDSSAEVSLLRLRERRLDVVDDLERIDRTLSVSVLYSTSRDVGFFRRLDGVVVPSEGLSPSDVLSSSPRRSCSLRAGDLMGIRLGEGDASEGLSPSDVSSSSRRSFSLRAWRRAARAETVDVSATPVAVSGGRPVGNTSG
jgi:hypothetical protein